MGSALRLLNYRLECQETRQWLQGKAQVVKATAELGRDLAGILATQRKLYGIERELAVAKDRLAALRSQADRLAEERPEVAGEVAERLAAATAAWEELQEALRERAASMGEAGQLRSFLQDLDDFQAWLFGAQKAVAATDDMPASLSEAEELLQGHEAARRDAEEHAAAFTALVEAGERVVGEQEDPQYEGLRQRLRGVEVGWAALGRMAETRHRFLTQCRSFQEFLRDAKQAEILLANQVGDRGGSRGRGVVPWLMGHPKKVPTSPPCPPTRSTRWHTWSCLPRWRARLPPCAASRSSAPAWRAAPRRSLKWSPAAPSWWPRATSLPRRSPRSARPSRSGECGEGPTGGRAVGGQRG